MRSLRPSISVLVAGTLLALLCPAFADDWFMFGRDQTRNAVSPEKNPPLEWHVKKGAKKIVGDKVVEEFTEDHNVLWKQRLGSNTCSDPVISGGLIWIGTNNDSPRDPTRKGDASVLMCLRERDGEFLWQYVSPRQPNRLHYDWPMSGLNCSPLVEDDRLWFTTNRCETICLDIGPLRRGAGEPQVLWKVDMVKELGVYPMGTIMAIVHTCSPAACGEHMYVMTGNGNDQTHEHIPAPQAPSLVCFRKDTGKVIWHDNSPGKGILDGQWASPLAAEIGGRAQVIAPFGDGWVRSFDALTGKPLWQFDTNPKNAKYFLGGRGTRNYLLSAPVLYENRIYIANGQHPEHGEGQGWLYCIDPTKNGDISPELPDGPGKGKPNPNSGAVWSFAPDPKDLDKGMARTCSNVAVHNGLVIAPTLSGWIHCLDARTGQKYWTHDALASIYASPLLVDNHVYVTTDNGDAFVLELGKIKGQVRKVDMVDVLYSSPVFANGTLYLATRSTLYAIREAR